METFGGSCRLCLWKGDKMISLFPGRENIISKIRLCLPIQVDTEDNLPKEICYECNYKLEIFSEFYQTCIRSDKILKQYSSQIRKTVKPEVKLETVVDEDSDFTSNSSILKSNLDTVNHGILSVNSEMGGLGSIRGGIKNSDNTVLCKCYNNELLGTNNSNINKVNDNSIEPSNICCIHKRKTYDCCYEHNCRNGISLDSSLHTENVNVKDSLSKNNVLLSKTVGTNNNSTVESVSKTCSSSSSRIKINSVCSLDDTNMESFELANCRQRLPYKQIEKLPNCDIPNYLQITSDDSIGSCEVQTNKFSDLHMNCYQKTKETSDPLTVLDSASVNENKVHKHKNTCTKMDNRSASIHSDQDNEKNTGFKEITCTPVGEDIEVCTESKKIITGVDIYSDKHKESKNSLHMKNYRKYYVNLRNGKNTSITRGRMKSDPTKGRRCEKIKSKKKIQKNVSSILVKKMYSCRYCSRKYFNLKWCNKHEQSHMKGGTYICSECNSTFTSLLQLNMHDCIELFRLQIKNDHSYCANKLENNNEMLSSTVTEKCDNCGKVFNSIVSFNEHYQNCSIKIYPRNKSNFKKKNISNKPQRRIKNYVYVKMKSTLRKINV